MWDWIITIVIVIGFVLAVWSKVSGKPIKDILRDIRDVIQETREGTEEVAEDSINSYGYYQ